MALIPTIINDRLNIRLNNLGASNGAEIVQLLRVTDTDTGKITESFLPAVPVASSGPLALPNLLTAAQTAALSASTTLNAQVASIKNELAAANATIADLRAQLEGYLPTPRTGFPFVRVALDKLALSDFWAKAVDLTIATLEAAEDADPKRIYSWWYFTADSTTFAEDEWKAIVAEMAKIGGWDKTSEADLIALTREIELDPTIAASTKSERAETATTTTETQSAPLASSNFFTRAWRGLTGKS